MSKRTTQTDTDPPASEQTTCRAGMAEQLSGMLAEVDRIAAVTEQQAKEGLSQARLLAGRVSRVAVAALARLANDADHDVAGETSRKAAIDLFNIAEHGSPAPSSSAGDRHNAQELERIAQEQGWDED